MEKEGSEKFYFVRRPRSGDFFLSPEKCKIGEKYKCNGRYTKIKREKKIYRDFGTILLNCFLKNFTFIAFSNFPLSNVISTLETIT